MSVWGGDAVDLSKLRFGVNVLSASGLMVCSTKETVTRNTFEMVLALYEFDSPLQILFNT